jgi:hypothetical protein
VAAECTITATDEPEVVALIDLVRIDQWGRSWQESWTIVGSLGRSRSLQVDVWQNGVAGLAFKTPRLPCRKVPLARLKELIESNMETASRSSFGRQYTGHVHHLCLGWPQRLQDRTTPPAECLGVNTMTTDNLPHHARLCKDARRIATFWNCSATGVRHVAADGTVRPSVAGLVQPPLKVRAVG